VSNRFTNRTSGFVTSVAAGRGRGRMLATSLLRLSALFTSVALFAQQSHAIAAPPPPCPKEIAHKSTPQLIRMLKNPGDSLYRSMPSSWTRDCAREALSKRGASVVPALMQLRQGSDSELDFFATSTIGAIGDAARGVVPELIQELEANNFHDPGEIGRALDIYGALEGIGEGSRPAIPLLIQKSLSQKKDLPANGERIEAIRVLGALGKYDSDQVVPHLARLLDDSSVAIAAAKALEAIGNPARSSFPAVRSHLAVAISTNQRDIAAALISTLRRLGKNSVTIPILISMLNTPGMGKPAANALGNIGRPAAAAVPSLIRRLDSSDLDSGERFQDIAALAAIDKQSHAILERILLEATRDHEKDGLGDLYAASVLAAIDPLPSDLAPKLVAAVQAGGSDEGMRYELAQALANTHTAIGEQTLKHLRAEAAVVATAPTRTAPTSTPIHFEHSAGSDLIDGPPIDHLSKEQLESLFADCQKYPAKKTARGPYGAAYCEAAITAWGNLPLEVVPIRPPGYVID
jgi:HEAT repeat protein